MAYFLTLYLFQEGKFQEKRSRIRKFEVEEEAEAAGNRHDNQ